MNINILEISSDVSNYLNIFAPHNFISCIDNYIRTADVLVYWYFHSHVLNKSLLIILIYLIFSLILKLYCLLILIIWLLIWGSGKFKIVRIGNQFIDNGDWQFVSRYQIIYLDWKSSTTYNMTLFIILFKLLLNDLGSQISTIRLYHVCRHIVISLFRYRVSE